MTSAKTGDQVTLHYIGQLSDGTVFDSSRDRQPLRFQLGKCQVIPGFDAAVQGMAVGEQKTVIIPADQAYGDRQPQLIFRVSRQQVPTNLPLEVGTQLQLPTAEGRAVPVMVLAIEGDRLVLDGNHPLAGEELRFEIELLALGAD